MANTQINKPNIILPSRQKPYLVEAYNGYYGKLQEFFEITVRFWKTNSFMYSDASLLSMSFPVHIKPTAKNGFMNEFHIQNIEECYKYSDIWKSIEFYTRNWKYCEYYIGSDPVYHNELDCYIANILKNTSFPDIEIIDSKSELKKKRSKWVHEKKLFDILEELYPDCHVIFHYRAHWLSNLELDVFIKEIKLSFEYQGIQHYEIVAHWNGEDGLKKRQSNDAKKKELCRTNGVMLIYFDYTEILTKEYVKAKINKTMKQKM